jgi:hypothetical protein
MMVIFNGLPYGRVSGLNLQIQTFGAVSCTSLGGQFVLKCSILIVFREESPNGILDLIDHFCQRLACIYNIKPRICSR